MTPETRIQIVLGRSRDYFDVMRTTLFAFVGLAAIIEFGPAGYSAPLTMLAVAVTAYGVLAGGTALSDIDNLRNDMDEGIAGTSYGKGVTARNFAGLKAISAGLVLLIGVAELYAILT